MIKVCFVLNRIFQNIYSQNYIHVQPSVQYDSVCVFILFLLFLGEWTSPTVIGDRPPPIYNFTLTSITNTTAILFGGHIGVHGYINDVYTFEFTDTSVVSVLH